MRPGINEIYKNAGKQQAEQMPVIFHTSFHRQVLNFILFQINHKFRAAVPGQFALNAVASRAEGIFFR